MITIASLYYALFALFAVTALKARDRGAESASVVWAILSFFMLFLAVWIGGGARQLLFGAVYLTLLWFVGSAVRRLVRVRNR